MFRQYVDEDVELAADEASAQAVDEIEAWLNAGQLLTHYLAPDDGGWPELTAAARKLAAGDDVDELGEAERRALAADLDEFLAYFDVGADKVLSQLEIMRAVVTGCRSG